jgi:hypothetical protein
MLGENERLTDGEMEAGNDLIMLATPTRGRVFGPPLPCRGSGRPLLDVHGGKT